MWFHKSAGIAPADFFYDLPASVMQRADQNQTILTKGRETNMANLNIGGIDCTVLAAASGTPLLVYDEAKIEAQFAAAIDNFKSDQFETEVVYASKAFSCKAIFKIAQEKGACLDVVSGGEMYCAEAAGFDMKNVYFHGNNKSEEELRQAL